MTNDQGITGSVRSATKWPEKALDRAYRCITIDEVALTRMMFLAKVTGMRVSTARKGSRIVDRPEYASKFSPLTASRDTTVAVAVQAMKNKNYGCIVITNGSGQVEGIVTERDIMFKLVAENKDPQTVVLSDIMTSDIRMAKETDNVLDWLRIMSNERFRRLPVVDSEGRLQALLTQGDFVSYTWPDLMHQAGGLAKAAILGQLNYIIITGLAVIVAIVALAI